MHHLKSVPRKAAALHTGRGGADRFLVLVNSQSLSRYIKNGSHFQRLPAIEGNGSAGGGEGGPVPAKDPSTMRWHLSLRHRCCRNLSDRRFARPCQNSDIGIYYCTPDRSERPVAILCHDDSSKACDGPPPPLMTISGICSVLMTDWYCNGAKSSAIPCVSQWLILALGMAGVRADFFENTARHSLNADA